MPVCHCDTEETQYGCYNDPVSDCNQIRDHTVAMKDPDPKVGSGAIPDPQCGSGLIPNPQYGSGSPWAPVHYSSNGCGKGMRLAIKNGNYSSNR